MTDTPERIGKYRVLNPLGIRGVAFRAWDPTSRRTVAITLAGDGCDHARFVGAARAAMTLFNPHLAGIIDCADAGEVPGLPPFAVSEFVSGRSLADRIRVRAQMDPVAILSHGADLCDALSFARAHDALFRPFAPSQAVVDREGTLRLLGVDIDDSSHETSDPAALTDGELAHAVVATIYDLLVVPAPQPVRQADVPWPSLCRVRPDIDAEVGAFVDAWVNRQVDDLSLAALTSACRALAARLAERLAEAERLADAEAERLAEERAAHLADALAAEDAARVAALPAAAVGAAAAMGVAADAAEAIGPDEVFIREAFSQFAGEHAAAESSEAAGLQAPEDTREEASPEDVSERDAARLDAPLLVEPQPEIPPSAVASPGIDTDAAVTAVASADVMPPAEEPAAAEFSPEVLAGPKVSPVAPHNVGRAPSTVPAGEKARRRAAIPAPPSPVKAAPPRQATESRRPLPDVPAAAANSRVAIGGLAALVVVLFASGLWMLTRSRSTADATMADGSVAPVPAAASAALAAPAAEAARAAAPATSTITATTATTSTAATTASSAVPVRPSGASALPAAKPVRSAAASVSPTPQPARPAPAVETPPRQAAASAATTNTARKPAAPATAASAPRVASAPAVSRTGSVKTASAAPAAAPAPKADPGPKVAPAAPAPPVARAAAASPPAAVATKGDKPATPPVAAVRTPDEMAGNVIRMGNCLDPSVFARILICESASSPVAMEATPAAPVPVPAPAPAAPNAARPVGTSGSTASPGTPVDARTATATQLAAGSPTETRAAELVTFVNPIYPDAAKRAAVTGAVEVDVTIDAGGRVVSSHAASGPQVLRASAEVALSQWRFRPAYVNGRPVMSRRRFQVSFAAEHLDSTLPAAATR